MSSLVLFDLDGVITSEDAYWDAAGLTLHELCYSPRYWNLQKSVLSADERYYPMVTAEESRAVSRAMFPEDEILALKASAINSNWDTCYVAVCMHLIDLLSMVPDLPGLLPLKPWDAEWLAIFQGQVVQRGQLAGLPSQGDRKFQGDHKGRPYHTRFGLPVFKGYVGLGLINRFDLYASDLLGHPIEGVFSRHSPFWTFCQIIFQEWYLGDNLFRQTYGHAPAQPGKPGCIHFERPLLPLEMVRSTLETLRQQGYVLGFATGRTYREAVIPLDLYGLGHYFDGNHISTYDHVERAEAELRTRGDLTLLGKPHPFQFLVAVDHGYQHIELLQGFLASNETAQFGDTRPSITVPDMLDTSAFYKSEHFVVVGDSTSDILGGRAAGAITVAVLTGARTPEARRLLEQSNPDFTIEDITGLPELLAQIDSLATIQRLQFAEKDKAERLLRRWFARHMKLNPESVTLTPKAVSLNSFNGFYRLDGEEYFFKTHVEEQGIVEEYYHADTLHKAGYNVVMPLQTIHEEGRQMVIYPVVRYPVMFDLVRAVEFGSVESNAFEIIAAAEKRECERLLTIYEKTLVLSKAEEHAKAPIHQLFWHRLTGGRFKHFYQGKYVPFPNDEGNSNLDKGHKGIPFEELLNYRWTIYNKYGAVVVGKNSQPTLGQLIERARSVLHPARETLTIIGHGDAHFGNVFLQDGKDYLYFDPAFAGRHSPLLDIVKPFFHNVYATWMYFPQEVAQNLQLSVTMRGTNIFVEHNFELTALRQAIFDTKLASLYAPLRDMLNSRGGLAADWKEIVWLAMMCCPLLTINLLDEKRIPPAVCWLGLAQAIEMGVRSTDERMK